MHQHAEAAEDNARRQALPRRKSGRGKAAVLAVLIALFVVVWWQGDAWLGPAAPPVPTNAEQDAALRTAMYLQVQRIKAYQLRTGRLPDHLNDAGPALPGIRYERLDARTYRITGRNGNVTLSYQSDQPIGPLMDAAASRIGS